MEKATKNQVEKLRDELKREIPDYQVLYKDKMDEWPNDWKLLVFKAFVFVMRILAPSWHEEFMERYSNGFGKFLILPSQNTYSDFRKPHIFKVIRHELQHMKDYRNNPILFILTYIFLPLPFLLSGRAYWELRAYKETLRAEHELQGRVSHYTIQRITEQFANSKYLWMFPFKGYVKRKLTEAKDEIETDV